MKRSSAFRAAGALAAVVAILLAARALHRRLVPAAAASVAYDLAALAPVALHEAAGPVILFGTAAAQPFEGRGILAAAGAAEDDPHVLLRRRAELYLEADPPLDKVALLDLAPLPGLGGQTVEVTLNDAPAGQIALREERARYAVALPAALQKAGRNVLGLAFERVGERQTDFRVKLAARLYALAVLPPEDALLANAVRPGALPLLSAEMGARPRVLQAAPTTLTYAVKSPRDGRLRFTPEAAGAGRVRARVVMEAPGRPPRELWAAVLAADTGGREVDLALPEGPLQITLEAMPDDEAPAAWAAWVTPRVVGGAPDPLFGKPAAPAPAAAAAPVPTAPPKGTSAPARAVKAVVLVILDAGGAKHFSSYGYPRRTTPEVDRLAQEGVLFEDAHSLVGYTLLAMGSVWTSQHPNEHHNGIPPAARLPKDIVTLAEVLSARGVRTAGFVGNAMAGRGFGLDRGFEDFFEVFKQGGRTAFRDSVARWAEANRGAPLFAYVHLREPHFPYDPGPPYETAFGPDGPLSHDVRRDPEWPEAINGERITLDAAQKEHLVRLYDGNLMAADAEVGRLRAALTGLGLWDDTAIIVTADHGEALLEHGTLGHEAQVEREVTHIPLVMRVPGVAGGRRVAGLVDLTDLAPTIAGLFGLRGPEGRPRSFRGASLLDIAEGAPARTFVVSRTPGLQPRYALRHERYTFHFNTRLGTQALFDVESDPGETRDISERDHWRAAYYRQALDWFVTSHRRLTRSTVEESALTPEQRENLRSLGYLN